MPGDDAHGITLGIVTTCGVITMAQAIQIDVLDGFVVDVLSAVGVSAERARICADVLIEQDLRGHGHHGVCLLRYQIGELQNGRVHAGAMVKVLAESHAMVAMDGNLAPGPVAANEAMRHCIELALAQGVGLVTLRQMPHWVIPAYYAMRAAAAGLVGYCVCFTGPVFAPTGSSAAGLGNNPFAYAVPADPRPAVVIDFGVAPSVHRVRMLAARGEPLPDGWATNRSNSPIIDPADALDYGVFQPFDEHRSSGLGLVHELLAGTLAGMPIGMLAPPSIANGALFMAYRTDLLRPHREFLRDVNAALDALAALPRRDPGVPVLYPGERSGYELRRNLARGAVDLSDWTWRDLEDVAKRTGVLLP